MRKVYTILFVCIYLIMTTACSEKNTTQRKRDNFSGLILTANENRKENLCFNDLIDSAKIVRLETTPESQFGDITKMEILNDTIIIFDSKNQMLLTFELNGKFLGKLGQKGKGPNEYINIRNIAIDRIKNEILLLDDKNLKIFHFTSSGKFLFIEDAEVYPHDLAATNGQVFYFQNQSSYYFGGKVKDDLLLTKDGKILIKDFPFEKENYTFTYPLNRVFYELNDTICFIDKWNSAVYSISNNKIIPRFQIDFNGNEIPLEFTQSEELFDLYSKKYSYLFDYIIENETYIYFSYLNKGKLKKTIYNKKQNIYYNFSNKKDNSDMYASTFSPIYSFNDFYISVIPAHLLKHEKFRTMFNVNGLENIISKTNFSDNVLLSFCWFKPIIKK